MTPRDRRIAEVCDQIVMAIFVLVVLALATGVFGE